MQYLRCLCLLFFLCFENGYAQNMQSKYIIIDTLIDDRQRTHYDDINNFRIVSIMKQQYTEFYRKAIISDNKYSLQYKNTSIVVTFTAKGMLAEVKSARLDSIDLHLFFDDVGSSISIKKINLFPDTIHIAKWRIIDNNLPKITTGIIEHIKYYGISNECLYYQDVINDTSQNTEKKKLKHLKVTLNGNKMKIPLQVIASESISHQYFDGYPNKRHEKRRYTDKLPYKRFYGSFIIEKFKYQGELTFPHQ